MTGREKSNMSAREPAIRSNEISREGDKVTIAGELQGNVEEASHVDLLQTGVVTGDLKTGSLTVAAGARMRGQAEFGWDDGKASKAIKYSHGAESSVGS